MKKTVYAICVCVLCVLVFWEMKRGDTADRRDYVPSARLLSMVQKENENGGADEVLSTAVPEEKKVAYLTFDDGPSENTKKILETLKEKKVTATFFLIGNRLTKENEEIVRTQIAQGNAVGVHTYCHEKNQLYCNAEGFFEDFMRASDAICKVTGEKPVLHRFPWGSNNGYVSSYVDELHEKLQKMGVKSFDWNVSGEDSIGGTVAQETIFHNVKKDLLKYQKPIILLHDSETMNNTAAVLGRVIDYIREQGYEFDTLEQREEYLFPASWR